MEVISKEKLISVIIPTYNCGSYICSALDSVLRQTYKHFEIIVVDDGSTDDTKEILKPYESNITYFYQKNGGLASARNKGLMMAKGEYVALLDADDIWVPNKLELQFKCIDKFPDVGLVFSDFSSFNAYGIISVSSIKRYFNTIFKDYRLNINTIFNEKFKLDYQSMMYAGDICDTMFFGNIAMPSSVLIKKECIDRVGMFNEKYRNDSDYDLFLRISVEYKSGYIDVPLMKYRILENSLSNRSRMEMIGVSEVIDIIENFIKAKPAFANKRINRVRRRFSGLYYESGYSFFSRNDMGAARRCFIKSIIFDILPLGGINIYLYFIASLLPRKFIILLKNFKKR